MLFDTFKMILMDYREVVYLVFAFGAIWGTALTIGIRMIREEKKHARYNKANKEI